VVKQSFFGLPGQYGRRVTKANWAFQTWFSKLQVYVLVWFVRQVMGGERKENDAEGKEIKSAFLSEASNDCYLRFLVRYKLNVHICSD